MWSIKSKEKSKRCSSFSDANEVCQKALIWASHEPLSHLTLGAGALPGQLDE